MKGRGFWLAACVGAALFSLLGGASVASADVVPAPPLTDAQLQALRQVSQWRIEIHATLKGGGSGGDAGGQTRTGFEISTWLAGVSFQLTEDDVFSTSGPPGCAGRMSSFTGGCFLDYASPNQFTLSIQRQSFVDVNIKQGCPAPDGTPTDPGFASQTDSESGLGTLSFDGTPGSQIKDPVFGIDYSTNPPRAFEGALLPKGVPTTLTTDQSFCGKTFPPVTRSGGLASFNNFFFDPSEGADDGSVGGGGDTQVRIENGHFVIKGSSDMPESVQFCPPIVFCSPTTLLVTSTDHWKVSWVVTSPPIATDTTPPVITVPSSPLTAEATGPSGAAVSYGATATDAVDGPVPVNCKPASGSTFKLGSTEVDCTATDAAGNVAHASFTVLVQDTTPPDVHVPSDITVDATSPAGAAVTYTAFAVDLVNGLVPVACAPPSGSTFKIGATAVGCVAFDSHGNEGQATFSVTVKGAAQELADLTTYVTQNQLGPGTSLLEKLQAAASAVRSGDKAAACGALKALINETNAQSGKKLTADQANRVIEAATRMRAVLGC